MVEVATVLLVGQIPFGAILVGVGTIVVDFSNSDHIMSRN